MVIEHTQYARTIETSNKLHVVCLNPAAVAVAAAVATNRGNGGGNSITRNLEIQRTRRTLALTLGGRVKPANRLAGCPCEASLGLAPRRATHSREQRFEPI